MNATASAHAPSPPRPAFICRACGHGVAAGHWQQEERLCGLPGVFDYGACARCGALSIAVVPPDLDRYYPESYHRFAQSNPRAGSIDWRVLLLYGRNPAGQAMVKRVLPDREARILDVGCGNGRLLRELLGAGYRGLCGVDPLLPVAREQREPFPIYRKGIAECDAGWDAIMYHHVLEHVPDPRRELALAAERLRPGGLVLVRVPLADSWARRKYGRHWMAWDPPRHLWVPTRAAMRRLAEEAGLMVERVIDDSTASQFWASRLYRRGAFMNSPTSPAWQRRRGLIALSPAMVLFHVRAAWLNLTGRGDQAGFVLRRGKAA